MTEKFYADGHFNWQGFLDWLGMPITLRKFSVGRYSASGYLLAEPCANAQELEWFVRVPKAALRVDMSPAYSPWTGLLLGRELFFDIDEWEPCSVPGACYPKQRICQACFDSKMLPIALEIETILRTVGYKKITLVFSGGRSVHIIVQDEAAFVLDREERLRVYTFVLNKLHEQQQFATVKIDRGACIDEAHNMRLPGSYNGKAHRPGKILSLTD